VEPRGRTQHLGRNVFEIGAHARVMVYSQLCVLAGCSKFATLLRPAGRPIMPSYSPELIQTMRAALDEVITKVPVEQATPGIKAALAEYILRAAAEGQTNYESLVAAASDQIPTILSMLT
jgi:hypothetical protein